MSADYGAWNAALAGRFLQGQTGVPLYLYTDDGVLEELAGEVGVDTSEAVDSFVSALRDALLGGEPFRRWATAARTEVISDSVPSYLGILCFLVFVAVERDTVHFQYYPALNQFLGRPGAVGPSGVRSGRSHSLPQIQRLAQWQWSRTRTRYGGADRALPERRLAALPGDCSTGGPRVLDPDVREGWDRARQQAERRGSESGGDPEDPYCGRDTEPNSSDPSRRQPPGDFRGCPAQGV